MSQTTAKLRIFALLYLVQTLQVGLLSSMERKLPSICTDLQVDCWEKQIATWEDCEAAVIGVDVVVDLWLENTLSQHLSYLASTQGFLHILAGTQAPYGSSTVNLFPAVEFSFIQQVFSHFNWTKATVLGSNSPSSRLSTFHYTALQGITISTLLISTNTTEMVQSLLARSVKSTGSNIILVNTDEKETEQVLTAAETVKMMKSGYAYTLTFDSLPRVRGNSGMRDGLIFAYPICEENITEISQFSAVKSTLQSLFSENISINGFKSSLFSLHDSPHYCLYNSNQTHLHPIAEFHSNQVDYLSPSLHFPDSDQFPGSSLSLDLTIIDNVENPTLPPTLEGYTIINAAVAGLEDVNKEHRLVPGFELQRKGISFGIYEFEREWATERIVPILRTIGLGIIGSPASSVSIGVQHLLPDLGIIRPYVSTSSSPLLSSPSDYPMFVRMLMSDAYMAVMYLNFLRFFGWKQCSVVYMQGDIWSEGVYQYFLNAADLRKFTIANDAYFHAIDDSLDSSHYSGTVQELIDCKARVVVLIVYTPHLQVLLRMLYDRGMRSGDMIFLGIEWLSTDLILTADETDKPKFADLLKGSITCVPHGFVGSLGARVSKRLQAVSVVDYSTCLYYDSTLLYAYALRTMLKTGKDFEDPQLLCSEMKSTRFVGCSGIVTFEAGTNDRSQMNFELNNLKYWSEDDTWSIETVFIYNPSSVVLYRKVGVLQWFDDSAVTPSDERPDQPCPNDRDLGYFPKGAMLLAGISGFIALMSGIEVWYIWSKWWKIRFTELKSRHEISIEDTIMFIGLGIELLQLLGIGPDITEVTSLVATISHATSLNLSSLVYMKNGTFWLVLDVVLAACGFWFASFMVTMMSLWRHLGLEWLEVFTDRWLPFIGDTCFLPIVSFLLNIYICERSYNSSFTSSVLDSDCFVRCWQDTHWVYTSLVTVCLVTYIPVAVYTRPAWQRIQTTLHVKTHPLHLMVSTLFQILLIIENKQIKPFYPFIYSLIYILTLSCMVLFFIFDRPHNYGRVNLWHISSYFAAIWMAFVSAISHLMDNQGQNRGLLFGGWAALLVFTLIIQRCWFPSLLYRKSKDTQSLFRFAFQPSSKVDLRTVDFNRLNLFNESKKLEIGVEFTLNPRTKIQSREASVSPSTRVRSRNGSPLED